MEFATLTPSERIKNGFFVVKSWGISKAWAVKSVEAEDGRGRLVPRGWWLCA